MATYQLRSSSSIDSANIQVLKHFNLFSIMTLEDLYDKEYVRVEVNDGKIVDICF